MTGVVAARAELATLFRYALEKKESTRLLQFYGKLADGNEI